MRNPDTEELIMLIHNITYEDIEKISYKTCKTCKKEKYLSEFTVIIYKDKIGNPTFRYITNCKECQRNEDLVKNYGITSEDYNRLLKEQNNRCSICRKSLEEQSKKLAVDHNHQTNKIRGLLCINCNLGLGNFQDSILHLTSAILYLEKHEP